MTFPLCVWTQFVHTLKLDRQRLYLVFFPIYVRTNLLLCKGLKSEASYILWIILNFPNIMTQLLKIIFNYSLSFTYQKWRCGNKNKRTPGSAQICSVNTNNSNKYNKLGILNKCNLLWNYIWFFWSSGAAVRLSRFLKRLPDFDQLYSPYILHWMYKIRSPCKSSFANAKTKMWVKWTVLSKF